MKMKKSVIATTAGIGLTAIALAVAPIHAGSKNHEQAMGLELDIVAAATIATDTTGARVIEAEFESKRDNLIWEIEMIDSENREIEVKVDIKTISTARTLPYPPLPCAVPVDHPWPGARASSAI